MTRTLFAAALLTLAILVACGDDDDDATTVTPSSGSGIPTITATPGVTNPGETPQPTAVPTAPGETPTPFVPPETPPVDPGGDYTSILQLVDKQHGLPSTYVPDQLTDILEGYVVPGFSGSLRYEAWLNLVQMLDAADAEGYDIRARSAYRSYEEQQTTFQYWVDTLGYEEATRVSAMPGFSEHQTGLAVDLTAESVGWDLTEAFGATAEGQWLAAHATDYGFALSYPACCEAVTGYAYEPWHFRFIGDAATEFAASGLALNQFLAGRQ